MCMAAYPFIFVTGEIVEHHIEAGKLYWFVLLTENGGCSGNG